MQGGGDRAVPWPWPGAVGTRLWPRHVSPTCHSPCPQWRYIAGDTKRELLRGQQGHVPARLLSTRPKAKVTPAWDRVSPPAPSPSDTFLCGVLDSRAGGAPVERPLYPAPGNPSFCPSGCVRLNTDTFLLCCLMRLTCAVLFSYLNERGKKSP